MLRAQAILRRSSALAGGAPRRSFGGGTLVLDAVRHEATVEGAVVDLAPTEWGILTALAAVPGRVYSRFELLNRVRGYELSSERVVDSHVKNLRRKLGEDPQHPRIVETVLGAGYRLGLGHDR